MAAEAEEHRRHLHGDNEQGDGNYQPDYRLAVGGGGGGWFEEVDALGTRLVVLCAVFRPVDVRVMESGPHGVEPAVGEWPMVTRVLVHRVLYEHGCDAEKVDSLDLAGMLFFQQWIEQEEERWPLATIFYTWLLESWEISSSVNKSPGPTRPARAKESSAVSMATEKRLSAPVAEGCYSSELLF